MKKIISLMLTVILLAAFVPTTYAAVNMVKNPGFEKDTSWWNTSGASLIRQEKAAASGNYGAYVTVTSNWGSMNTPALNFKKGVTYTVSAKVKLAEGLGTRNAKFITSHTVGGDGTPKWIEFGSTPVNDKEWTLVVGSFCYQGTNKTGKATLQCRVGSGSELLSYYIDDYSIISSETTSYRETEYDDDEMVENKGFDIDTDGWEAKNGASISRVAGQGYDNSEASGLVTTNGSGYVGVQLTFSKGQKYDMSAYVKTEGNSAFFNLVVRHNDGTTEQVALLNPTDKEWNAIKGQYLHRRENETALVYLSSNNTESYYIDEMSVIPTGAPIELETDEAASVGKTGITVDGVFSDISVYASEGGLIAPVCELARLINGIGTEEKGIATLKRGINTVVVKADAPTISVNGKEIKLPAAARLIDGKLCADAAAVAIGLGVLTASSNGTAVAIKTTSTVNKLNYAAKKLREDKSLTIGILTGSRAQRAGTYDPYSVPMRDAVESWFNRNYADCSIKIIENDVSSTGIMLGAFRAKKFVSDNNIDLLLVDVYRNDINTSAEETEEYAATLIRGAREANGNADIVFLYTLTQELYDNYYSAGKKPESYDGYEKIAAVYSVPTLDLGERLIKKMESDGKQLSSYHNATMNPNTDGAKIYADGIIELIKDGLANADEKTERISRNHARSFDAKIDTVDKAVLGTGWCKVEKSLSTAETDSYIEANMPGAEMTYTFSGNIIGLYFESNPKSGNIKYSIDNGAYESFSTFDEYSYEFEHISAAIFAKNLSEGEHTLKIKVDSAKNEEAKDTLIRIGGFLVGKK